MSSKNNDRHPAHSLQHWSQREVLGQLDSDLKDIRDTGTAVQHLDQKQAAKERFIQHVKDTTAVQAQALHGDRHDSKTKKIVNYISEDFRDAVNARSDELSPAAAQLDETAESLHQMHDAVKAQLEDAESYAGQNSDQLNVAATASQPASAHASAQSQPASLVSSPQPSQHKDASTAVQTDVQAMHSSLHIPEQLFKNASYGIVIADKISQVCMQMHNAVSRAARNAVEKSRQLASESPISFFKKQCKLLPEAVRKDIIVRRHAYGSENGNLLLGRDAFQIMTIVKTVNAMERMSEISSRQAGRKTEELASDCTKRLDSQIDSMDKKAAKYADSKSFIGIAKKFIYNSIINKVNVFCLKLIASKSTFFHDIAGYVIARFKKAAFAAILAAAFRRIYAIGRDVSKLLKRITRAFIKLARRMLKGIVKAIRMIIKMIAAGLKLLAKGIFAAIKLVGRKLWSGMSFAFRKIGEWFLKTTIGKTLSAWVSAVKTFFTKKVPAFVSRIYERIGLSKLAQKISGAFQKISTAIKSIPGRVWEKIASVASKIFQAVKSRLIQWSLKRGIVGAVGKIVLAVGRAVAVTLRAVGAALRFLVVNRVTKKIWAWLSKKLFKTAGKQTAKISLKAVLGSIGWAWLILDIIEFLEIIFPNNKSMQPLYAMRRAIAYEFFNAKREFAIKSLREQIALENMQRHGTYYGFVKTVFRDNLSFRFGLYNAGYESLRMEYEHEAYLASHYRKIMNKQLRSFYNKPASQRKKIKEHRLLNNVSKIRQLQKRISELSDKIFNVQCEAYPDIDVIEKLLAERGSAQGEIVYLATAVGLSRWDEASLKAAEQKLLQQSKPNMRRVELNEKELEEDIAEEKRLREKWNMAVRDFKKDIEQQSDECIQEFSDINDELDELDDTDDMEFEGFDSITVID